VRGLGLKSGFLIGPAGGNGALTEKKRPSQAIRPLRIGSQRKGFPEKILGWKNGRAPVRPWGEVPKIRNSPKEGSHRNQKELGKRR